MTLLAKVYETATEQTICILGFDSAGGPASYPMRPFYVELSSGLRHWFESERTARNSQYWPKHSNYA